MTEVPQERPISLPPPKAAASTVQSSLPAHIVNIKSNSTSRSSSGTRNARPRHESSSPSDFTSKASTIALIRRTLIADSSSTSSSSSSANSTTSESRASPKPIEDTLPPLTSSNEVDLQLYAIVAIIVKDFVNTWYSKITPDHTFVVEIISIIAHCSRALEERIRHTDIPGLLLDDLTVLIERHVIAYRTAHSSLAQHAYDVDPRVTYHSLNPHPALGPPPKEVDESTSTSTTSTEQSQNEAAYRQMLVTGTLAVLLPTDDIQNTPLRVLVGDVIADLILGQAVAEKVCEGWFLHDAVTKTIVALKEYYKPKATGEELRHETKTKLEEFGLLDTTKENVASRRFSHDSVAALWFWRVTQWGYFAITALWFVMHGLFHAGQLPKRLRAPSLPSLSLHRPPPKQTNDHERDLSPRPVLAYHISNLCSTLLRMHDRMPWLESTILFWQNVLLAGIGHLGGSHSILDRFLHDILSTYVFSPKLMVNVLIGLRIGIFPNNSLGPAAPPPPSIEERRQIRRRAAISIFSLIPASITQRFFDTVDEDDILQHIEEDILDVFGDKYMNKHLIYGIVELVLVTLSPELREAGIGELFAERGISWGSGGGEEGETRSDHVRESVVVDDDEKMEGPL